MVISCGERSLTENLTLRTFYEYGRLPLIFHYANSGRVIRVESSYAKDSWKAFRKRVFERDNYICKLCGKDGKKEGLSRWVCDHIIPLSIGGRDWWQDPSMSNFQTLCPSCDNEKCVKDIEIITNGYFYSSDPPDFDDLHNKKEVFLNDDLRNKYNVPLPYIHKIEKFYYNAIEQADIVKFAAADKDSYVIRGYVEYALKIRKRVIEISPENVRARFLSSARNICQRRISNYI